MKQKWFNILKAIIPSSDIIKAIITLSVVCLVIFLCHQPYKVVPLDHVLKDAKFPIFAAESYTNVTRSVQGRKVNGCVLLNASTVHNIAELKERQPKYLVLADDILIREMIESELSKQAKNPNHLTIPISFFRNESFLIVEIESRELTRVRQLQIQYIKVIGPALK